MTATPSGLNETDDFKLRFNSDYANNETQAVRDAASVWKEISSDRLLPSILDGRVEIDRLEP